jgi:hypothetical protein
MDCAATAFLQIDEQGLRQAERYIVRNGNIK